MTSNITPITAASNGGDTTDRARTPQARPARLREKEAHGLISLGLDALYEASNLGHDMHKVIYGDDATASYPQLQDQLAEALACLETAEHYLFMLGSVFEEHPDRNGPPRGGPRLARTRCRAWRAPTLQPGQPQQTPSEAHSRKR